MPVTIVNLVWGLREKGTWYNNLREQKWLNKLLLLTPSRSGM